MSSFSRLMMLSNTLMALPTSEDTWESPLAIPGFPSLRASSAAVSS